MRPVAEAAHDRELALGEAEAAGVLPLTSTCNVSCLFCSNRANPPGVRVYHVEPRPLAELDASLRRMGHLDEIVIGESAFRVSEGEPMTHPDFDAVIRLLRSVAPDALLKLTTNGILLDAERAALLAQLGPLEITLSVNTVSREAYQRLHRTAHDPQLTPALLTKMGLPYHASVVAVPAVTGREDLTETVRYLEDHACLDCRVFVPGWTRLTPPAIRDQMPAREEVLEMVQGARAAVDLPVTLEPPEIGDLRARLAGVGPGTAAARAGLRPGDVIAAVDGQAPLTRVDAFRRATAALRRAGTCHLTVERPGEPHRFETDLKAETDDAVRPANRPGLGAVGSGGVGPGAVGSGGAGPGAVGSGGVGPGAVGSGGAGSGGPRPGFVLDRDIDPAVLYQIVGLADRLAAGRIVVLTSILAAPVMEMGFQALTSRDVVVVAVASRTFGGSIACAGLLTVDDFAEALALGPSPKPGDAVFLPPIAFDKAGLDLLGRPLAALRPLLARGRLVAPGLAVL